MTTIDFLVGLCIGNSLLLSIVLGLYIVNSILRGEKS